MSLYLAGSDRVCWPSPSGSRLLRGRGLRRRTGSGTFPTAAADPSPPAPTGLRASHPHRSPFPTVPGHLVEAHKSELLVCAYSASHSPGRWHTPGSQQHVNIVADFLPLFRRPRVLPLPPSPGTGEPVRILSSLEGPPPFQFRLQMTPVPWQADEKR